MKNFKNLFRILPLIIAGSFFSTNIFSADYYWVGGTGDWSAFATHWATASGGTTFHTSEPTANDDVFFDDSSFGGNSKIVTIDVPAYCKSMDWSAITNAFIQMSGTFDLHINGSLTMKDTVIITGYTGALYFESANAGNTITSATKTFTGAVYFNGVGGDWTLQDPFTTTGDIYLNDGTLVTNNYNLTGSAFNSNTNNARGLTLGASTVTLTGYNGYWGTGGINFVFDAGASLIKFTYAGGYPTLSAGANDVFYNVLFQSGTNNGAINGGLAFHNVTFSTAPGTINANNGTSFHKVIFNGDGALNNNAIYDSLLFTAGKNYTLENSKTQTINNYLQADGTCILPIILQSNSAGTRATLSQATGSVTVTYVQMQDISATGGATFTANYTTDIGNNTGWTMTASAPDLYWIPVSGNGSGTWNAPDHWSATSGGTAACIIPNPSTNAHFDANSFTGNAQTVTLNVPAYCKSMDWSAINKTSIQMSGSSDLHISGSLNMKPTIGSLIITGYTGALYFESVNTGNTITSSGKIFSNAVYFNGNGGEWTLQDAFTTTGDINLNDGTLVTNNYNLTGNAFNSNTNNARGLTLGASTVTLTSYNGYWGTGGINFAFDAGTSLIKFTYIGGYPTLSAGANDVFYDVLFQSGTNNSAINGGLAFHNVTFSAAPGTINANNGTSFHKVIFNGDGALNGNAIYDSLLFSAGKNYTLENSKTQTINNYLQADGTCLLPIILQSNSAGTQAAISQATGSVTVTYVQMQDIEATGGATFTANYTSDIGNNTGWTMTASPSDLYWIGGNGSWNEPNHWSTASGGSAACIIPTPSTNVFFDASSFGGNSKIVTINVPAYCKSMDWSAINKTSIQMSGSSDLHINGSLTMKNTMIITGYTGALYFESANTGNTITSATKTFTGAVYFNGVGGDWTLQDAFTTAGDINLNDGTLLTNNYNLTGNSFNSNTNNARGLTLGASTVTLTGYNGYWGTGGINFAFDAGTSLIKFTYIGGYPTLSASANDVFYDVLFQSGTNNGAINGGLAFHNVTFSAAPGTINANNGTSFHKVIFNGDGALNNNAVYDSLLFTAGYTYTLENNKTQTINNYLQANGTCTQPIILHSNSVGSQAIISQTAGSVTVNYVQMQDINAIGGATFAANNTADLGNNTGWVINANTSVAAGYTSSQNGLTATFTNTSTGATSFKWIFGDGSTSTQQNSVHTYNLGGNYNACLIAYNACGGSDTVCKTVNAGCTAPVANYAANVNGLNVSFANSSTNAANVLWKFGDATSSTSFNPVHTYFNSGTYTVCLTVSNGCGKDSICQNVTVTCAAPVASYYYAVNGMTVNFTNGSSNAATSNWTFGDSQSSVQNSPLHTYNTAGTYNVKLKITNGCGSDSLTQAVTVVCSAPVANFVTNPQGLKVDFVSTSTDATSVQWDFGDGSSPSILPAVNHSYTTTGTYTVCLTANNGCGTNTYCIPVSVCASPVANFTSSSSVFTATFTNTSTNGINYYWTFGDANASNSISPTHIYSASGTYTVCLIAGNSCGSDTSCNTVVTTCSPFTGQSICLVTVDSTSSKNVIVWEKPVTTSIDSFRIYREFGFNNYVHVGTVDYDSLSWFTDTTNGVNPNIQSYRYKMSIVDTCGNESALSAHHRTIHLSTPQFKSPKTFDLIWGNDYEGFFISGYNILRDSNNTGNFDSIAFVTFGNLSYTDLNAPTDSARYIVEAINPSGCSVSIKNPDPLATTVQSSRSNTSERTTPPVSIAENSLSDDGWIKVYPNPSSGIFTIDIKNNKTVWAGIKVFNMLGEEMKKMRYFGNGNKIVMDLSKYPKGIYYLQISTIDKIETMKIIFE